MPKPAAWVVYSGIFIAIIAVIALGYQPPQQATTALADATKTSVVAPEPAIEQPSVDKVVAAQIAGKLAVQANMVVATDIKLLVNSLETENTLRQTDTTSIIKPRLIQLDAVHREIQTYVVKKGDSIGSIAAKFKIKSSTLRWANNIPNTGGIKIGQKLKIPPVDGVLHKVEHNDTYASLAKKYNTIPSRIQSFNDLELSGLKTGATIIIPYGTLPEEQRPGYVAPTTPSYNYYSFSYSGNVKTVGYGYPGPGGGYAPGNCTAYAYNWRLAHGLKAFTSPPGRGNANNWDVLARANGMRVDHTPTVGAIAQWEPYGGAGIGWYGHVAIVESLNSDGTITVSEMNYEWIKYRVTERTIDPASVSNFIH